MPRDRTLTVTIPPGWHLRSDVAVGIVLAARPATVPTSGHQPELVLRATPVEGTLLDWRDAVQAELAIQLPGFRFVSGDHHVLGCREVDHRRFTHALGSTDLTTEQWSWLVDGIGLTLSCTAAREDHAAYADLFAEVAGTVEVLPRVA